MRYSVQRVGTAEERVFLGQGREGRPPVVTWSVSAEAATCGTRHLIALSDHQLSLVMTAARALDVEKRDVLLQRFAQLMQQAGVIR